MVPTMILVYTSRKKSRFEVTYRLCSKLNKSKVINCRTTPLWRRTAQINQEYVVRSSRLGVYLMPQCPPVSRPHWVSIRLPIEQIELQ